MIIIMVNIPDTMQPLLFNFHSLACFTSLESRLQFPALANLLCFFCWKPVSMPNQTELHGNWIFHPRFYQGLNFLNTDWWKTVYAGSQNETTLLKSKEIYMSQCNTRCTMKEIDAKNLLLHSNHVIFFGRKTAKLKATIFPSSSFFSLKV